MILVWKTWYQWDGESWADLGFTVKEDSYTAESLDMHFKLHAAAAAAAKSLQSCPTLCDRIYGSPPGSSVPGILRDPRQEHWSRLPFPSPMHESEKWKWSRSGVSDCATPWTAAHQAPPPMGVSRQEYWSGVPLNYIDKEKYRGCKFGENKLFSFGTCYIWGDLDFRREI